MRLTLPPLTPEELKLAVIILRFDEDIQRSKRRNEAEQAKTIRRHIESAIKLNSAARVLAQRAVKAADIKVQIWRYNFEEITAEVPKDRAFREWIEAAKTFRKNVTERAGWFPFPWIALPAKKMIPAITDPRDLVIWFSVRLFANRQHRFFVRCKLCGKFAVRKRSSAAYCGDECQHLAMVEATYKRRGADFSEWLLSQPKDRWLPPRMEMRRTAIARSPNLP